MSEFPDGLPRPRRDWAIATIGLVIIMAVMDGAIANVALPTIARDLHTNATNSIWIVNGYQLAIAVSLLPLAALGEIITYRRVFIAGLALFTFASLLCALSLSFWMLAAARILQGFGAAGIMSVNTALLRFTWPHAELGRGIGVNALLVAVAAALGPTVAAAILSIASWPYLFAVNIPLGLMALAVAGRTLPDSPRAQQRFDSRSAIMSAAMFALFVTSIDALGHGEALWIFGGEMVLTGLIATVLVRQQLALPSPLLPVDLLGQPLIALSVGTSILSFTAQMLALVSLPFLLQTRLGFSAVATGLLITPWSVATSFAAPIAGRLSDRYPAGLLSAIGLIVFASGLAALANMPAQPAIADVIWRMALCGAGFGLFQSPNNRAMIGNAPRARAGGAAGMLGTARLLGQTTGAALVALCFGQLGASGQIVALEVAAGAAVLGACISAIRLFDWPQKQNVRTL